MTRGRKVQLATGLLLAMALGWSLVRTAPSKLSEPSPEPQASAAKRTFVRSAPASGKPSTRPERETTELQRPHPITPLHDAMAKRREVLGALAAALEHHDHDRARQLLGEADELAAKSPEGSSFRPAVRGYHLILACLAARGDGASGSGELPGDLLEASRKYVDDQRLPPRRQVRRVCLEGLPFARRA